MADEEEPEKCGKCSKEIDGGLSVGCEGKCSEWFHLKCAELTVKEYNVIKGCKRLKWFCDICYESEVIKRTNDEVIKEIKQLKDQISRLEEKVSAIKVDDNDNVKYSNAGAEEIKQRSEAAIIISAKNEDINKHTSIQNDLKGAIKPQELRIGVNNMKTTGAGKVKISCEKKTDILKLKSEIESKLGSKYDISEVKTRKPKIKIVGINENMDKDELKNTIIKQNELVIRSIRSGYYSNV
ncbi:hypothetical protein WA026_011772 [Henosepilachna vigintioctopunctata]|uniref:PHD-type domain-containing protein n=1 Tax=Henosepilachna vigintioctopunctata TaxID=420089 RepID=A0AAW1UKE8_9CUCU